MKDANDVVLEGGRLNPSDAEPFDLGRLDPPYLGHAKFAEPAEARDEDEPEPWEPPVPFARSEVPDFPAGVFPPWVESYVENLSTALQVPRDLPAVLILAVAAAAAAKCYRVAVAEGWSEPLNLFAVVAMPPASRKSPVFARVAAPLVAWESERRSAEAERVAERRIAREALESQLQRATRKGDTATALQVQAELDAQPSLSLPRLLCDDTTPEKLVSLLAANGGRMALLSAEGGVFGMMAGRYSKPGASDLDVYLKGHCGDPIRVDRVTREGSEVARPALTIGLAVQPSVIEGLAARPDFRGRGLLGRFAYSLPESRIGRREVDPPPVPEPVDRSYSDGLRRLLGSLPQPSDTAPLIPFDGEARAARVEYQGDVERSYLDPDGLLPIQDWGGKLVGLVCRLAGLLALLESPTEPRIDLGTFDRAVKIGAYFQAHARAAFGLMGADPAIEGAKAILGWIRRR